MLPISGFLSRSPESMNVAGKIAVSRMGVDMTRLPIVPIGAGDAAGDDLRRA